MLLFIRQHDEHEKDKKTLKDEEDKTLIVKQEQFTSRCDAAGDVDCEARASSMARRGATPHPPRRPRRGAARRRTHRVIPSEARRDAAPTASSKARHRTAPHQLRRPS